MRTKFGDEPMSMIGSLISGGRYNVRGLFGALYLGFDRETCEAEVSQGIAAGVPFKSGAFTVWDYTVDLSDTVRLDENLILNQLGITKKEITIPGNHWTASGIGEHLFTRGDVEAIVAPSAHKDDGLSLDIYLDKLKSGSTVKELSKLGTWPLSR